MAKKQLTMSSLSSFNNDDLFTWEFVNQSDCSVDFSDVDSNFDVRSFDLASSSSSSELNDVVIDDVVVDDFVEKDSKNDVVNHQGQFGNFIVDDHVEDEDVHDHDIEEANHVDISRYVFNYKGFHGNFDDDDDHHHDEDDDDDGMDDDLVPREMKGIYMRQRIKKSEKKSLTKMCRSKKLLKCVRGRYAAAVKAY